MNIFIGIMVLALIGLTIYRTLLTRKLLLCGLSKSNVATNMLRHQLEGRIYAVEIYQFTVLGLLLITTLIFTGQQFNG